MASSLPEQNSSGNRKKRKFVPFLDFGDFPALGQQEVKRGRFVVLEDASGKSQLSNLNPRCVEVFLRHNFPGYVKATPIRDGKVMVLTDKEEHARRAIRNSPIDLNFRDIKVKVTDQPRLNSSRATIYNPDLTDEQLAEFKLEASYREQNIIDVERIMKFDFATKVSVPTKVFIVTFDSTKIPDEIAIFWRTFETRQYFPNPLRCTRCQKYGHTKNHCASTEAVCRTCASVLPHESCGPTKCVNCGGAHPANDIDCPARHEERAIIQIQTKMRIPYNKAKLEFARTIRKHSTQTSFTEVVRENPPTPPQEKQAQQPESDRLSQLEARFEQMLTTLADQGKRLEAYERAIKEKDEIIDHQNKQIQVMKNTILGLQTQLKGSATPMETGASQTSHSRESSLKRSAEEELTEGKKDKKGRAASRGRARGKPNIVNPLGQNLGLQSGSQTSLQDEAL